jgi:hypothetical protein
VSEIEVPINIINKTLYSFMDLESKLIRNINGIPIGVSVMIIAEKNKSFS